MRTELVILVGAGTLLFAADAFACKAATKYDWAVPAASSCVTFVGPPEQGGSPALEVTNGCNTSITVHPVDCAECDTELVLRPAETGNYTVHYAVGEGETAMFGVRWEDESGNSGTISGSVSLQEGFEDPCDDGGAVCATSGGDGRTPTSLLVAVVVLLGLARFRCRARTLGRSRWSG